MFWSSQIPLESDVFYRGRDTDVKTETQRDVFQPASVKFRRRHCLVIVEGMNDVLRMECLQVAALGLGRNKVTSEQLEKLFRYTRTVANNQALLLPDCDEEGETEFKDLLWKLCEAKVQVRLGWSSNMFKGTFQGLQPEDVSIEVWRQFE